MIRRAGIGTAALALLALVFSSCATRTVEDDMAVWPEDRIKTFIDDVSPVDANTLNMLQDAIIALYGGDRVLCLHPFAGQGVNWAPVTGSGYMVQSVTHDPFVIAVPLLEGDRPKSMQVLMYGNGTVDVTIEAYKFPASGVPTQLGIDGFINLAAAWTLSSVIDLTGATVGDPLVDGECVYISIDPNATGCRIGQILFTYDHPTVP